MVPAVVQPPDTHIDRPVVLVVEDEVLVRMLIADVLQEAGYKTIEAKDATEALRVLQARPDIHLVMTDVEMPPGPTGLELAREICDRWPYLRVVISSGRVRPGLDELPPCANFLPKPWSAEALLRCINEALERAQGR